MRRHRVTTVVFGFLVFAVLAFALVSALSSATAVQQHRPQTAAQMWLSWRLEARANFVRGYLSGFEAGKHDACSFYGEKMSNGRPLPADELPEGVCLKALPKFTEPDFGVYVDEMTTYYTKYPTDYMAGWPILLHEMAVSPGITAEQIYAKRHPHD